MDALDLLSDDEDDASVHEATETTEPDAKRQKVVQLDFKDLQRVGYAAGGEEDEKSKMENAFSSFDKATMSKKPGVATEIPGFATTYQILKDGNPGRVVSDGCKILGHVTGVMTKSGKKFWESRETQSGKPHLFMAGDGNVDPGKPHLFIGVVGFEQGCLGMRIGEIRKLSVPSKEGYGAKGVSEWEMPPHCDLEFTVECLNIAAAEVLGEAGPTRQLGDTSWRLPAETVPYRYPSSSTSTSYSA